MAIMNPLQPRMGRKITTFIAVSIWILGVILSCPNILFFTTYNQNLTSGEIRIVCYLEWPDGPTNHSLQEHVYNVLFMFLTYFIPIGSMSFTYARVGLELWGSQSIGECTQRQLDNIKSKRRVVKMMMVVVLIFAVCWLPFHIYFIVTSYYPEITNSPYIQEIYLAIYWLAMSNSMYNPIIYCWMNSRFRRGFKQFFRWCPFINLSPEILQRREAVTSRYSCSGSPDRHRIVRNDTQRSFLYTSPGSPKNHRLSRGGSMRIPMHLQNNNATTNNKNNIGYSLNSDGNIQNNNTNNNNNEYQLTKLSSGGGGGGLIVGGAQKWATNRRSVS